MSAAEDEAKNEVEGLRAMAKRLGFKGEEIAKYVDEHMTRLGYKARKSYYKDQGRTRSSGSGFSFLGGNNTDDDED